MTIVLALATSGLAGTAAPASAAVTWTVKGPLGGTVHAILAHPTDPDIVFARTDTVGVLRSVNGGDSWANRTGNLPSTHVRALALSPSAPDTLYASVGNDGGVWKTTNAGGTWNRVGAATLTVNIDDLAVGWTNSDRVYAVTSSGGDLWTSDDGGASWDLRDLGTTSNAVSVTTRPGGSLAAYVGTQAAGVYRTTDGGGSWSPRNSGLESLSIRDLAVTPANATVVTAITASGLFRSTDGGGDWDPEEGLPLGYVHAVAASRTSAQVVYAAVSGQGAYRRSPAGAWTKRSDGFPANQEPLHMAVLAGGSDAVVAGFRSWGFRRTTDGGVDWTLDNTGFRGSTVSDVTRGAGGALWAVMGDGRGAYRSSDGGVTWTRRSSGLGGEVLSVITADPDDPSRLWAAGRNAVFTTTDNGLHWTKRTTGFPDPDDVIIQFSAIVRHPTNADVLYASASSSTDGGVFRSDDGGISWLPRVNGLPSRVVSDLVMGRDSPQTLYATTGSGVAKTTDAGQTWDEIGDGSGLPDEFAGSIARHPSNAMTLVVTMSHEVFRTTNGGTSWSPLGDPGGFTLYDVAFDLGSPTTIYAASGFTGVYRKVGSGPWSQISNGLINDTVETLLPLPGGAGLVAATHGGVATTPLD